MIYLYTAPPGTGKTCWVVKQLVDNWIPDPANSARKIYSNIAGLKIDGIHSLPDGDDFRKCEDGSIIIIDEPQEIEHYSSDSRAQNPVAKALSKHRHRGFDIHFITQDPSLLHKYVLKNVYLHYYLWRPAQRQAIEIYTFARAIVSPSQRDFKNAYDKIWWRFEEYYLQFYKSTVVNTSKKTVSTKRKSTMVTFVIFMLIIAYFMYPAFANSSKDEEIQEVIQQEEIQEIKSLHTNEEIQEVIQQEEIQEIKSLPTSEELQIKENERVAFIAIFKSKCIAKNPYGRRLNLTLDECLAVKENGIEPSYLVDDQVDDYEMPELTQPDIDFQASQFIP